MSRPNSNYDAKRFASRLLDRITWVAGLPVALVLFLLRIRFVHLSTMVHIGHVAAELDYVTREWRAGRMSVVPVLLAKRHRIANNALLDFFARELPIATNPLLLSIGRAFDRYEFLALDTSPITRATQSCPHHRSAAAYADERPSLHLTERDHANARPLLEKLGIPDDRWLATLHAREGGFDGDAVNQRNVDIRTYLPAVAEIAARGGYCIRMGDASMTPMPDVPNLLDYALSDLKCDLLDIYLIATSRFYLGNTSGLVFVASAFGVPIAATNMVPFGACLLPDPRATCIPKLLTDRSGRRLSFAEMAELEFSNDLNARIPDGADLSIVDSDPEEMPKLLHRDGLGARVM